MTHNDATSEVHTESPLPHPALRCLDMLVGTWQVTGRENGPMGEIHGTAVFAWMEGGCFLLHHIDINHLGQPYKGIEYIGYDETAKCLRSHYFGTSGDLLEYIWEPVGYTLTIWVGKIGSDACFRSKFNEDYMFNKGRWEWPGGGYELTMRRVSPPTAC